MTFEEYQERAEETAMYPGRKSFSGLAYATLGLAGEAGELANKVKKIWRDSDHRVGNLAIKQEIGDCLWYLAEIASNINVSLEDIAGENLEKLQSRFQRNKIGGSGDNR